MRSLLNAIDLYREEAEMENKKQFIIVKIVNNKKIPLKNLKGREYFNSIEEAEIERIYYQPDYNELLKVIKV